MPIVKLRKPVESKSTHVHLIFKPEYQERMQDLKKQTGANRTEIVRMALDLLNEVTKDGLVEGDVLVLQRGNKEVKRITLA